MKEIISKKEVAEIMKTKGEILGDSIKVDLKYILFAEGKEGLQRLEDEMARLGYSIKYKSIKRNDIYPAGMLSLEFTVIDKIFHYDKEKLEKMGRVEVNMSLSIIRFFARYFISIEKAAKEVQRMWAQHYNFGKIELKEYDMKKKYVLISLDDFKIHPSICYVFKGYFAGILEMIVGHKVSAEETKCVYRGDDHHEFLLKW
jgi:hypothetical protein